MTFRGVEPIRTKIVIINQIVEQVSHFNYLENDKVSNDVRYNKQNTKKQI